MLRQFVDNIGLTFLFFFSFCNLTSYAHTTAYIHTLSTIVFRLVYEYSTCATSYLNRKNNPLLLPIPNFMQPYVLHTDYSKLWDSFTRCRWNRKVYYLPMYYNIALTAINMRTVLYRFTCQRRRSLLTYCMNMKLK